MQTYQYGCYLSTIQQASRVHIVLLENVLTRNKTKKSRMVLKSRWIRNKFYNYTCSKQPAILWMWTFVRFDCVLNDLALSGGVRRLCTLSACVQSEEITQNSLKILPHNTSCKKSSWYFWHSLKNIAAIRMPTYRQVLLGLGGAGAAYIYFKPRPKPFHIKVRKHQW